MNIEENKIKNKYKSFFGIVIIGVISSAMWELLFKNILFEIGNYITIGVSFFYSGYFDYLYNNIGRGGDGIWLQILPSVALIVTIICLPFYLIFLLPNDKKDNKEENQSFIIWDNKFTNYLSKKIIRLKIFIIIISLPIIFFYSNMLLKGLSTMGAYGYINRNIEIIHPYIKESEFLLLISKLRQIDNKEKLVDIITDIDKIAKKNNIKLDECTLYGIDN